ncbi:hypothetical protein EVAR_27098_1 [Eumeta japonica]|uniref:Uncharacterized protein n=1 Tax=Eumeta variegata TaxID=151549 RepID=A0A4C1VJ55_EUMVA|nr:hypothetical protein EVAR_27098_1 [Eumeta japonica]
MRYSAEACVFVTYIPFGFRVNPGYQVTPVTSTFSAPHRWKETVMETHQCSVLRVASPFAEIRYVRVVKTASPSNLEVQTIPAAVCSGGKVEPSDDVIALTSAVVSGPRAAVS